MATVNVDGDLLRKDLMDYYGTAAFSGFPCAMMDVFAVERMSGEQLWAQAEKNGFRMDRYITGVDYTPAELYTASRYVPSYIAPSYQPSRAPVNTEPSKVELTFPTYEDAIRDIFFITSGKAQQIIDTNPADWETILFSQLLQDFSYQLVKLKKQTATNPFVKAIGSDSEGRPLLYFIVAFADNLSTGIEKAGKATDASLRKVNRVLTGARRWDEIRELAIGMMEPYRIFLSLFNDLSLIEMPEQYTIVYSELRKVLKSLLSDCDAFYYELSEELNASGKGGINSTPLTKLKLHGFYTKKISDTVLENAENLRDCKVKRRRVE